MDPEDPSFKGRSTVLAKVTLYRFQSSQGSSQIQASSRHTLGKTVQSSLITPPPGGYRPTSILRLKISIISNFHHGLHDEKNPGILPQV